MKMRTEVVKVTPDTATKWLEGNTHNRPVRDSRVHQYAQDMKAGRWGLTHQGIAFDRDGVLLDGQHRLWAVVEANVPVEMLVTHGLDMESQQFIDEGLPRSVVDVKKLADPNASVSTFRVAVARRMLIGLRTQVILSRQELMEFFDAHDKAIAFVIEDCFQGRKVHRVMPAAVAAVVGRASYHEPKDRLRQFGKVMLDGMPETKADHAAVLLRNWLLGGAILYNREASISRDVLIYQKAQRALVAFINGEQLRNLYPLKDDQWPFTGERRRRPRRSA